MSQKTSSHAVPPTTSSRYVHEPLLDPASCIRLLRIINGTPGEHHDYISCEMKTFNSTNRPGYQALSYRWGPESPTHNIILNGKPFTVRQNLYDFLEASKRNTWALEWIWIDQICIDRANLFERSAQVQHMSEFYNQTIGACIWLGDCGDLGNDMIKAYADQAWNWRQAKIEETEREEELGLELDAFSQASSGFWSEFYVPIEGIYREAMEANPYWNRMWPAQEIYLAPRIAIFCSNSQPAWCDVRDGTEWQRTENHNCLFVLRDKLSRYVDLAIKDPVPSTLLQAVFRLTKSQCSDTRDHVYGILAMLPRLLRLQVDYAKSEAEVFLDCLHEIFLTEHMNEFLRYPLQSCLALATKMRLLKQTASFDPLLHSSDSKRPLRVLLELFIRDLSQELEPLVFTSEFPDSAYCQLASVIENSRLLHWTVGGTPSSRYVYRHDLELLELQERLYLYQKILDSRARIKTKPIQD